MFFSICLSKKSAETIEFLRILKKYFSKNKNIFYIYIYNTIYFCLKKEMSCLIKKGIFIFHMIFKLSWCRSFTVLSIDFYVLFSYFCCSLIIPVSKIWDIERIQTLLCQYKWQTFNKMSEKRSIGYQSVSIEHVTGYVNSLILQLLSR